VTGSSLPTAGARTKASREVRRVPSRRFWLRQHADQRTEPWLRTRLRATAREWRGSQRGVKPLSENWASARSPDL
jgi:hypothetical protein